MSWKRVGAVIALSLCWGCLRDRLPGDWDPPYRCQGNEPFWNLVLEDREAHYRALAQPARVFHGGPRFDMRTEQVRLQWAGAERSSGVALQASLHVETCLDTMSDETPPFAYRAEVRIGREVLRGCCRRGG